MCQCGWISTISHFLFSYHIIYRTTRILWTILGQTLYSFTYSLTRLLVVAFFPCTLLTNHTWFIHFVLLLLLFICWYYMCQLFGCSVHCYVSTTKSLSLSYTAKLILTSLFDYLLQYGAYCVHNHTWYTAATITRLDPSQSIYVLSKNSFTFFSCSSSSL